MRPLTALRLRRLVIRQFSSSTSYLIPSPCLLHQKQPFLSSHVVPTNFPKFLSLPSILPLSTSFSSQKSPQEDPDHIAQSLSTELIKRSVCISLTLPDTINGGRLVHRAAFFCLSLCNPR